MKIDLGLMLKVLANAAKDLLPIAEAMKALGYHEQAKGILKLAGEMPELKEIARNAAVGSASNEEAERLHQALHHIVGAREAVDGFVNGLTRFLPMPKRGVSALEAARGANRAAHLLVRATAQKQRIEEAKAVLQPLCQDGLNSALGSALGELFAMADEGFGPLNVETLNDRLWRQRRKPASASV